tara:strand:+ start:13341 stop:13982 length:642 start_codon:yes stop_codon:yes gene_type:complete
MKIEKFTFNPFAENTYVIYDERTKDCIIIDPGCYESNEEKILLNFILSNKLVPSKLINTHCHIDHIFGNNFVMKNWNVELFVHKKEEELLSQSKNIAKSYGFENYKLSPKADKFIDENDNISIGNEKLKIFFTPGHSPGHICLYNKKHNILISGDVIFMNSIGRTDLPGGNYKTLIDSIKTKIINLPEETNIFCGHGPSTTLIKEKINNPFLN